MMPSKAPNTHYTYAVIGTRILKFVAEYRSKYGWSPTAREVGAFIGQTASGGKYYLIRLWEDGYLNPVPGSVKAMTLTDKGQRVIDGKASVVPKDSIGWQGRAARRRKEG